MLDRTTAERPATTQILADEMADLDYANLPASVVAKVKERCAVCPERREEPAM